MAHIYPLNNRGGVQRTIFDFTHLSPPPTIVLTGDADRDRGAEIIFGVLKLALNTFFSVCFMTKIHFE